LKYTLSPISIGASTMMWASHFNSQNYFIWILTSPQVHLPQDYILPKYANHQRISSTSTISRSEHLKRCPKLLKRCIHTSIHCSDNSYILQHQSRYKRWSLQAYRAHCAAIFLDKSP
jgi:hypothetical protein